MLKWFMPQPTIDTARAITFLQMFKDGGPWLLTAGTAATALCTTEAQLDAFIKQHAPKRIIRVALTDTKQSSYVGMAFELGRKSEIDAILSPTIWLKHPTHLVAAWRFKHSCGIPLPAYEVAKRKLIEMAQRIGFKPPEEPLPDQIPVPGIQYADGMWTRLDFCRDRDILHLHLDAAGEVRKVSTATAKTGPRSLDDYEEEAIEWLWPNVFPFGKLSLLGGLPGVGKSQLLISIAAALSKGGTLPDGSSAPKGASLILASEDDAKDTIKPRVRAAGGVMNMIYPVSDEFSLSDPGGFEQFIEIADSIPDLRAVFFDPIDRYAEGNGMNVRRALTKLIGWAARKRVSLIGILHPPKNANDVNIQNLFGGSSAFMRVARAAWISLPDRADTREFPRVFFLFAKSNIIGDKRGYVYETKAKTLPNGIETVYVEWQKERLEFTAEKYLNEEIQAEPKFKKQVNLLDSEYSEIAKQPPVRRLSATVHKYAAALQTIFTPGGQPIAGVEVRKVITQPPYNLTWGQSVYDAAEALGIERGDKVGWTGTKAWLPPSEWPEGFTLN